VLRKKDGRRLIGGKEDGTAELSW